MHNLEFAHLYTEIFHQIPEQALHAPVDQQYEHWYAVSGLYDALHELERTYYDKSTFIIMGTLCDSIYTAVHKAAAGEKSIQPRLFDTNAIKSDFIRRLKDLSTGYDWTEEELTFAKRCLEVNE